METVDEEDHLRQLQKTVQSDPDNPSHHFNLGVYLWEKDLKELKHRAAEQFVTAAKLNPNDSAAFRYLGLYYSKVSIDVQRALKCFQRAVSLNAEDSEAGEALCDLLDGSGKESLEVAVCREAAEKSPRAFWAFRRLGYLQINQKKWYEAVQSLQHAIRGYPTCSELWEALGLAYGRMGMYTAALKSYGRAIELEDSRVFALVESGHIHLMLGTFRKGIEHFRSALKISPQNLTAYFGLASGLHGLSKECVRLGAFSWAAALLEEASTVAIASARLAGNVSSIWKLLGDIQIAYANCLPWEAEGVSGESNEKLFKTSVQKWKRMCISAASRAKHSYQQALHLTPWQANLYADVAVSLDVVKSLQDIHDFYVDFWQLPEKMALGSLLLDGVNSDFWVTLGCLAKHHVLKQHAFIRALQLDGSLSVAWSYLGKHYRELGEKKLAQQAFDRARSIDPSLALPWAGMSVDCHERDSSSSEAFESCLRAVQIMPLAEFQIGLANLAAVSKQLLSPQVFVAIKQAVQRAPNYPETHNLYGLICEARSDFQSAIFAYQQAKCAFSLSKDLDETIRSQYVDVSINLARSLCQAGQALDAAAECENLLNKGLLDSKIFQIYAVALWHLGKNDQVLTVVRKLAQSVSTMNQTCAADTLGSVSTMNQTCAADTLGLICTLTYRTIGLAAAVASAAGVPKELLNSKRLSLLICALNALDPKKQLHVFVPCIFQSNRSHDVVCEIHTVVAISKMIGGSKETLEVYKGVDHLRKILHMYPDSTLIRNQLGLFLHSSGDWMSSHRAARCATARHTTDKGLRWSSEVNGVSTVCCYSSSVTNHKFTFPTCKDQPMHGRHQIHQLQKWLHEEPWNHKAVYLLILNVIQKAREMKFPRHLLAPLQRLLSAAISKEVYKTENGSYAYEKVTLLLCASEISLQSGDCVNCAGHAKDALEVQSPHNDPFLSHLQICRAYALKEDLPNLRSEYMRCLKLQTSNPIGWLSVMNLGSRWKLLPNLETIHKQFRASTIGKERSQNMWEALFDLVSAQCFLVDNEFLSAEKVLEHACSLGFTDSCLLLCHGTICLELARQRSGSQFISRAVRSLTKAQENSPYLLPIVSALLAQAEASIGAKANWERNLRMEWYSWPAELRPAELYFQMHLLAKQAKSGSKDDADIESTQTPERWILRAVHLNPSCLRYWKVLLKLVQS